MGEIIRTWLRTRLGVIIDLSPDIFGHYARDGTLLAKLLYSYDIINENQLRTLTRTQDPALSRVNLKNLRIWLRFVNVDCDDDCTEDISNGKGTAALRLFYKVFLALENKDTLHFITLQKEREKFVPNSAKFDVATVDEDPEPRECEDHPLAELLRRSASLIDWHRNKHEKIVEGRDKVRKKFRFSSDNPEISKSNRQTAKNVIKEAKFLIDDDDLRELDVFAEKHRVDESKEHPMEPCDDITKFRNDEFQNYKTADEKAAEVYTKSLKRKYRQEATTKSFKTKMQKALLTQVWKKVVDDQELEFDELIARKVLNQSQYEKKMMRKLCDVRNEKTRMAGNRQIVEELSQRTKEREARLDQERAREVLIRENEEVEAESCRMRELERRIDEDTKRRKLEKNRTTCEKLVKDLIDVSVMAAEYKMAANDNAIPKTLWNQLLTLFLKCQPIVESANDYMEREISSRRFDEETDVSEDTNFVRASVLNNDDFDNYHNFRSPWKDFVTFDDIEDDDFTKLGIVVLGHIVHKVLNTVDPLAEQPLEPPIPKMKIRSQVLGIPDVSLREPLRQLLDHSGVHVVCMEDAINHCLNRYKTEMTDHEYIDLKIVEATRQILTRQSSGSVGEPLNNRHRKRQKSVSSGVQTSSSDKPIDRATRGIDKLTQTPRIIPWEDMDPILSDAAYIGKWTHEFLTLGQPLSDDLNARILLEYLKSLTNYQGFVVVNYPTTYEQMIALELALTGRRFPKDRRRATSKEDEMNIEEIDPIAPRIIFENESRDSSDVMTNSRLVPDPREGQKTSDVMSYFTSFIAIKPKSMIVETSEDDDREILDNDRTPLEAFYVDLRIATIFYYTIFDLTTLKTLARLIITGETSISKISDDQLFGEALKYFDDSRDGDRSIGNDPIVEKLTSLTRVSSSIEIVVSESSRTSNDAEIEVEIGEKSRKDTPRPGTSDWSWANLPQPLELVRTLADLWQSLENLYIDDLKNLFQLKRTNVDAMIPYNNLVKKHMKEYVDRPDTKQDLLHEFHRSFNEMDDDIRDDTEVKHELYCRVADFETVMWDVCNDRRKEAEEERKRIVNNNWTSREAIVIANVYIGILQAEIDRFVDTLQFIQDYYLSMLQRPLQDSRRSRISLEKFLIANDTPDSNGEISTKILTIDGIEKKEFKDIRAKTNSGKTFGPPSCPEVTIVEEEIVELLTTVKQEKFDPTRTMCYKSIEANVHYVRKIVESMAESVVDILKKEETMNLKSPVVSKDKKGSSRKATRNSRNERESLKIRDRDFFIEWRYALMFEINRIRLRLKILDEAAKSDISFLIDSMQRLFFGIHEYLVNRYKNEVNSVNSMASTFRFAIEEAIPIQKEMLLDGDRFVVRSNVLMYPNKIESEQSIVREAIEASNFRMVQLDRLLDIFRRVAPSGILAERSFVYILQDLIACADEDDVNVLVPSSWLELRACDVSTLVNRVFGDVRFVDWREFIILAMDIDSPSVDRLLDALSTFRKIDENFTDTVTLEDFHSIKLWFFDFNRENSNVRGHKNGEEKEETFVGFDLELDKTLESSKLFKDDEDGSTGNNARLFKAKELLGDIFSCESRRVNYMDLLLNFCKDEDPKVGLGKALSLASGHKICVDWIMGERYVEEIMEKKRRDDEDDLNEKYLRREATLTSEAIMDVVLSEVFYNIEFDEKSSQAKIPIEQFDMTEKISLDSTETLKFNDEIGISMVKNADRVVTFEDNATRVTTIDSTRLEDREESKNDRAEKREVVYWLNVEICQAVLAAMLPELATQSDVFETTRSLRENIKHVFTELRENDVNDKNQEIISHRFFQHDFVEKLINSTNKFTNQHLGNLVNDIIREKKKKFLTQR